MGVSRDGGSVSDALGDASNALVVTPPGDPKARVAPFDLIGRERVETAGVLAALYEATAEEFLDDLCRRVDRRPSTLGFVGIGQRSRSVAPASSGVGASQTPIRSVERPDDLDAIERAIHGYLDEWTGTANRPVVYLDSVTGLLQHVPLHDVVGLLERLTDRIRSTGGASYVRMSASASVGQPFEALAAPFDAVIEVTGSDDDWNGSVRAADRSGSDSSGGVPSDDLFDALRKPRRRVVLRELLARDRTTVDDLVRRVVEAESGPGTNPSEERRYGVQISLYQVHLPKLADVGFVDFDADAGTVELAESGRVVGPYLALAGDDCRSIDR